VRRLTFLARSSTDQGTTPDSPSCTPGRVNRILVPPSAHESAAQSFSMKSISLDIALTHSPAPTGAKRITAFNIHKARLRRRDINFSLHQVWFASSRVLLLSWHARAHIAGR